MGGAGRSSDAGPDDERVVVRFLGATSIEGSSLTHVRGVRQAGLLALLCADLGRPVPPERLIDELWDGRAVSDAALRVTLKRLRDQFEAAGVADPVESGPGGYGLRLAPDDIDLIRYEHLVERAREALHDGRGAEVLRFAASARSLWSGAPFVDLAELRPALAWAERAERLTVDVAAYEATVRLQAGQAAESLAVLDGLGPAARHREDVTALRMVAAYRCGRRDLALAAADRLSEDLWEDVGVGPGRTVTAIRAAVERDDHDAVAAAAASVFPSGPVGLPAGLPESAPASDILGRDAELAVVRDAVAARSVLVLRGVAGIGKSTVAGAACDEVRRNGATALHVRVTRFERGSRPLIDALDQVATHPSPVAVALDERSATDADLHRFLVHRAALEVLRSLPTGSLVVVDDLQWLDGDGARLVWQLVDGAPDISWIIGVRSGPLDTSAAQLLDEIRSHDGRDVVELTLGPLDDEQVDHLVRAIAKSQISDAAVDRIVQRSDGWPLLAVELARHARSGGDPDDAPDDWQRRIDALLGDADPTVRDTIELLAVAQVPMPLGTLVRRTGRDEDRMRRDLGATGLVLLSDRRATLSHDLVAEAVRAGLDDDHRRSLHLEVARALQADATGLDAVALRHALAAGPAGRQELESAIRPGLRELVRAAAYEEAASLAGEVLDAVGPSAASTDGLSGRVQIASVLLTAGDTQRGLAVLEASAARLRRLDDPELLAEAVIARGPVDVGGGGARLAQEAIDLMDRLPTSATNQRVQLGCWAAHHLLMSGTSGDVAALLDDADNLTAGSDDPELHGLVLGIRYQASTVCGAPPSDGPRRLAELRRWASLTGSTATDVMARLFALDEAGVHGSVADLRSAVGDLERMVPTFPRPDVRWYVEAGRAGVLLAEGRFDEATTQIERAAELGRELALSLAPGMERLQQLVQLAGQGSLAALSPMFADTDDEADDVQVALAGLCAALDGDAERATWAAEVLAGRPHLLPRSGARWPTLAHLAGELAAATGHAPLGEALLEGLGHRAGTGMAMLGLVVLGSADRVLGLGHLARGDRPVARAALQRAATRDEARGLAPWAALATDHLRRLTDL